jgi:hypothetical protein
MSAQRPVWCRVRIRDATKMSLEAASGWRPSAAIGDGDEEELVLSLLMRMSTWTRSRDERSIMACAHEMERLGLITDQSSRRPIAAARQ